MTLHHGRALAGSLLLVIGAPLLSGCGMTLGGPPPAPREAPLAPTPASLGGRSAGAWLANKDLMMYRVDPVVAVHYADVASAYGAARLARETGDQALLDRIRERYRRLAAENIPNSANHVDANVAGVWDFAIARNFGDQDALKSGVALADGQWAKIGDDGLTTQARYWIDDVWMIGALQIEAWRVTKEKRFLDRAAITARRYVEKLQQPNGLFHHGPAAPFFWGRGNGWVAAGLAEVLSELPSDHPDYPVILVGYRRMMAGLLANQGADGMWHQLIDHKEAWNETSGTAMFGYAMAVGVRRGILVSPDYRRAYRRAWEALATYVEPDGRLREICVGTGQSKDVRYYLERPRTTGDLHGQAALLWFAAQLAEMERSNTPSP